MAKELKDDEKQQHRGNNDNDLHPGIIAQVLVADNMQHYQEKGDDDKRGIAFFMDGHGEKIRSGTNVEKSYGMSDVLIQIYQHPEFQINLYVCPNEKRPWTDFLLLQATMIYRKN